MTPTLGGVLGAPGRPPSPRRLLGGYVDSLLQTFENCRPGLKDSHLGTAEAEEFFARIYAQEKTRLVEAVSVHEAHLDPGQRHAFAVKVDALVREIVIPAYVRLAVPFTRRERNDFYAAPEGLHGIERVAWTVAGVVLGAFVVWAPFIPVWEKEWVLPFALGGLLFPEIRRWAALRRYQRQLNDVVARTDAEIARVDLDLLTQWAEPEIARAVDAHDPAEEGREGAVDTAPDAEGGRPRPEASRVKQGGGR